MKSRTCSVGLLAVLAAGCASSDDPVGGGIVTRVSSMEYARMICKGVLMEEYATCVNGMLQVYEEPQEWTFPPNQTTSGPFLIMLGGRNYYGWYRSQPFVADFRVSDGLTICRGAYNAFTGSTDTVFAVTCDDGRRGTARTVRDMSGANGVGTLSMDNGDLGRIVFGRDVLRGTRAAG